MSDETSEISATTSSGKNRPNSKGKAADQKGNNKSRGARDKSGNVDARRDKAGRDKAGKGNVGKDNVGKDKVGDGKISDYTVRRLSVYCHTLEELEHDGIDVVSSARLAKLAGTNPAQVRKDLSYFGNFGKRGSGYPVTDLKSRIRKILGIDHVWRVVLVGAGNLGSALFSYKDFERHGFQIVSILDTDPKKVGTKWDGIWVSSFDKCKQVVISSGADVAVLVTPAAVAQDAVNRLVDAGIKGILNFAPVKLEAPDHVQVRNVNITIELEGLSFSMKDLQEE